MAEWLLLSLALILVPLLILLSPLQLSHSRLFSRHRSFLQLCKVSKQFAIRLNTFRHPCLVKNVWYCEIILPKDVRILESKKCLSEPCPRNLGSYWEFCVIWSYTMRNHERISLPPMMLIIFQTNNENKTLSWRIRESKICSGTLDKKRRSLFERSNKVKNWSNCMWKGSERRQAWTNSKIELNSHCTLFCKRMCRFYIPVKKKLSVCRK